MSKAVLVMDMPESCSMCKFWNTDDDECYATGSEELSLGDCEKLSRIGVRFGNCRRKQIILLIVIMEDLIKAGMPA